MSCAGVSDDVDGDDDRFDEDDDDDDAGNGSADDDADADVSDGGEKDDGRRTEGSSERAPVAATCVVGDSNETRFLSGGGGDGTEEAEALAVAAFDDTSALSFGSECCSCESVREWTNDSPLKFAAFSFKLAVWLSSAASSSDSDCAAKSAASSSSS
jgi:hypothetical protein